MKNRSETKSQVKWLQNPQGSLFARQVGEMVFPMTIQKLMVLSCGQNLISDTLPETNIAPENRPLEKDIPIGNHDF